MRSTSTAVLAFLLLVPLALADDSERLVRGLGSPSYVERESASRELADRGEEVRGALEAAARSEDPEVRARARELLDRLDRPVRPADGQDVDWPLRRWHGIVFSDVNLDPNTILIPTVIADPLPAEELVRRLTEFDAARR